MEYRERENFIKSNLLAWGRESFPDNPDVNWPVGRFQHSNDYSYVESEPHPPEVGYPRFKFVVDFRDADKPEVVGCYAQESSEWFLQFGEDPNELHSPPPRMAPQAGCLSVLVVIALVLVALF